MKMFPIAVHEAQVYATNFEYERTSEQRYGLVVYANFYQYVSSYKI